ncbi:MAG TPA: acyltransferase family protein, partial [Thermoanaerobaculia bacterium]|nr:acyltransferase family protein [Thermoanaerobaculia bacterium]
PAAADAAPASRPRLRDLEAVAGLAMILMAVLLLTDGHSFPGWWALLPTVGSVLLLDAGPGAWLNRSILASRPMVAIGLVSYPLYLWHWPLLSFARVVESQTPPLGFRLVAVGLAFVLAALTYWLVEKPFRYGGHASRKIWILALSMAAVTATGRITASRLGLPWRSTVQAQVTHQRALLVPDDSAAGEACKRRYGFDEPWAFCLLDRMDAPPTVALVGDSHARHLVAGLKAHFREVGENLVFLGTRLPIWGATRTMDEPYQQVTDAMLDIALETATVHTVIVSTKLKLETRSYGGRRQLEMLETTLERFLAAGKRVIYVDDVPKLDFEPRQCIRRAAIPTSKTKVPCAMERRVFDKKTAKHRRALAALLTKLPAVELFDAPTYLCDERYCHAMLDGWLLYRDKDHLSNDGDLWLGRKFAAEQADGALALGASSFVERQARDESARSELSPSRRAPQAKGRSKRSNEERAGGGTAEIAEPR